MLKKLRRFSVWLLLEALIFIAALTIIDVFDEELKTLIRAPKTTFVNRNSCATVFDSASEASR